MFYFCVLCNIYYLVIGFNGNGELVGGRGEVFEIECIEQCCRYYNS
jgi:hypothetical protein